jgi:hypothetical protein
MDQPKRISKKLLFAKTVEILQPKIGLSEWKIVVKFSNHMKCAADCEAFPEYKQAIIRANLKTFKKLTHYEVIMTAVHEMTHCIIWPIAAWAEELCDEDAQKLEITRKLEEGLVTDFEKILSDLCANVLQEELTKQGYSDILLITPHLQVVTESKKITSRK